MIRSKKTTTHAKGQPCQARFGGICNGNPETTVFAHLNGFGKGMGMKAPDYAGFFSCSACHDAYDRTPHKIDGLSTFLLYAVMGTWGILIRDGIIKIPEDAPQTKTVKPRKPREARAKIKPGQKLSGRPFPKRPKV